MSETKELEYNGLVNRLAQEVAQVQRQLGASQQKLHSVTRSLEARTQELIEARAALDLLLATLDASQDGILAMGYFGRAMHFNSRFVDMWGIAEDRASCLNEAALLALQMAQVKDPELFLEISQARRARPDEERCDLVELTDGRILECHVMPQRVRGRRVGSVTSFRDVTDKARLDRIVTLLESEDPERVAEARATTY
ncbi:PAS domain S-box protein [Ramlibacter sp. PS4R-6]|uniref:PAS domain S-box protein n=1 Tax=Ramlibacter sp. PS4R-6 TaxID=3133438 RepID=UPI00309A9545